MALLLWTSSVKLYGRRGVGVSGGEATDSLCEHLRGYLRFNRSTSSLSAERDRASSSTSPVLPPASLPALSTGERLTITGEPSPTEHCTAPGEEQSAQEREAEPYTHRSSIILSWPTTSSKTQTEARAALKLPNQQARLDCPPPTGRQYQLINLMKMKRL